MMEQDRIIGPGHGAKPREILVGPEYLQKTGQVRAEAEGEASISERRARRLRPPKSRPLCLPARPPPRARPPHAQTLDEVVNGVEATYGKIVDLRAEFTQTARNKSLGQDIKAEGIVLLKKGGKMRWDYKSPAPQQIVSDGTSLWVYTPELNQVNKGNAPKALAGPAGSFLSGLGKLREEFTVRFLNPASPRDGAGRPVLDLTPKQPTPLLTRLVLTVDPEGLRRPPGGALRPVPEHRDHDLQQGRRSIRASATRSSSSRRRRTRRWCRWTRASEAPRHGRREQLRRRLQDRHAGGHQRHRPGPPRHRDALRPEGRQERDHAREDGHRALLDRRHEAQGGARHPAVQAPPPRHRSQGPHHQRSRAGGRRPGAPEDHAPGRRARWRRPRRSCGSSRTPS